MGIVNYLGWFFFEVQTIFVGIAGNTEAFAAHGSFQGIIMFFFMIPLGNSQSINSFLGNLVGEKNLGASKIFCGVAISSVGLVWLTAFILQSLTRPLFIHYMTTSEEMK